MDRSFLNKYKEKFSKLSNKILRKNDLGGSEKITISPFAWIFLAVVTAALTVFHTYGDILITAKQSLKIWDCLFSLKPFDFYKEARMVTGNPYYPVLQGAAYPFLVYLIFAVWNLPVWILENITGKNIYNTIPSMIWMKCMLLFFVFLSARKIAKILDHFSETKRYSTLGAFMLASSSLVFYTTDLIGQYDIMCVYFILIGFDGWINKNNKKFMAGFAIAMFFKYFALLYFVPLLLLDQKKIGRIIASGIAVLLPVFIVGRLFPKPAGQGSLAGNLLTRFTGAISFRETKIMIFPLIAALVCIFCFLTEKEENEIKRMKRAVFLIFIMMGSFGMIASPLPYWNVVSVPVFVLSVFFANGNINKMMFCETFFSMGIVAKNYVIFDWCSSLQTVSAMGTLPKLLGRKAPDPGTDYSMFSWLSYPEHLLPLIVTASLAVFVVMIYLARPGGKRVEALEPLKKTTIMIRTVGNALFCLAPTIYAAYILLTKY